jgi:hypothetical protein
VRALLAGLLVAGVAMIGFALWASRAGEASANVAVALRGAACTLQVVAAESPGDDHLTSLEARVEYNTWPPTNGRHFVWWAPWAVYRTPVSPLQTVHNLEHGGIVIQYGNVSLAEVEAIERFYLADPDGVVVAPLPELGGRISIAAWTAPTTEASNDFGNGRLALCPRFDEVAFAAFRDAYRFRGPEPTAREALRPGR